MIAKISFTIKKPTNVNDEEFIDWVKWHCGDIEELPNGHVMSGVQVEDLLDNKHLNYKIIK